MNGKNKILTILLIINILISFIIGLYKQKTYAAETVKQSISDDIDSIDEKKYPGIKNIIQDLQKKHPNWNFKVLYTGLKWDDVIKGETATHGNNVVSKSIYGKDWICSKCGKVRTYSGGSWYCASEAAVKYMMDIRNSLNETDLFQFLQLSYDSNVKYDKGAVKAILKDTFLDDGNLDTYVKQIMSSCKKYNVNPYYIAAKIIQEQGKKGGVTFKMKFASGNGKYKIDETNKVLVVNPKTTVEEISEYLGTTTKVKNILKKDITNSKSIVATGYTAEKYTIAVLGDLNGDGKIKATDYMEIKNYVLGKNKLTAQQLLAADINEDGEVKETDYLRIKDYILGLSTIELQKEIYYYNIFNIRATGKTTADILKNALEKAKNEEWTTVEKCLDGGIKFVSEGYIGIGQDSMYLEKFCVVNTTKGNSYYTHQYAQDLLYAQNQGTRLRSILSGIDAIDYKYTFVIPLYEKMPSAACARPISK